MSDGNISVILSGGLGRMGSAIAQALEFFPTIEVVGILDAPEKAASKPVTVIRGKEIPVASRLRDLVFPSGTVIVDFSTPAATRELARTVSERGAKLVVGTTGLSDSDVESLHQASQTTAVLVSSNMSVGVQVLLAVVEQLAARLHDFDVEIVEMHHRRKKDAPSGTALMLAEAAARSRGVALNEAARHGRKGMVGERKAEEIGLHAVRGGDIVGEHIVVFAGEGEHLELRHSAHSRTTFAMGALRAALFLADKARGFFTMRDVVRA